MPDTTTTNFGFIKPEIGGSRNAWGQKLHDNYDKLDGLLWQPRRNLLINGAFDIWQRGTSFTGSGIYTADRWKTATGGGTHTVSRLIHTPGAHQSKYCLVYNRQTAATAASAFLSQRIEGVHTLNGKQATLSFTAVSRDGTNKTLFADFIQEFGTGGTPSAAVDGPNQSFTVTPTQQRFSLTFDIPSIAGKTVGDYLNDDLEIRFLELSDLSTFNIWIDDIQLEEGAIATPFERRHIADELALCQRYYQTRVRLDLHPLDLVRSEVKSADWGFAQEMRAIPSIAFTPQGSLTGTVGTYPQTDGVRFMTTFGSSSTDLVSSLKADAEL